MKRVAFSIILAVGILEVPAPQASPASQAMVSLDSDAGGEVMLNYLKPILRSSGKVARIYYVGSCRKIDGTDVVFFPNTRVKPPLRNDTGLAAVKEIFRDEHSVRSSEGTDGIIRIVIGQLPATILDTRINALILDKDQQYTENLALWRIANNKEVHDAKQKLGIDSDDPPLRTSFVTDPRERGPHLPASIANVTMDQALDSVAKTFGNIVLYGTCAEAHRYTVYYVPLEK